MTNNKKKSVMNVCGMWVTQGLEIPDSTKFTYSTLEGSTSSHVHCYSRNETKNMYKLKSK